MTIGLLAKNKLVFVNGDFVIPTSSCLVDLWKRCNDMVISWSLNTLSQEISASGNCDVATYFTKLKTKCDELCALNLIPSCTCGTAHLITKRDEDQKLVQFLMGLNPCYESIRGNILMTQPLPSINQAYVLLMHDEKQREIHSTVIFPSDSASMNVNSQAQNTQFGRYDKKRTVPCSNCKQNGHHASKCYRIIGFPKDFKFTKYKRGTANMVENERETFDQAYYNPFASKSSQETVSSGHSITTEQYHELMQLLQKTHLPKESITQPASSISYANFASMMACISSKFHSNWIIDTGASDHMCHDISNVWHSRLGHLPFYKMKQLSVLSNTSLSSIDQCHICPKARQHRLPFPHSHRSSTAIFDLIHIDVWGPYHTSTYSGYKYFLTIVDDFSRTTWTPTKAGVFPVLQGFVEMVAT
ncbi:uncharacterized protein LOC143597278 [Bidens hawaiensis]|uniref:uncharacterized protein LOC143597278 n=1 Tax=Bidens hawaiensis TaxID=980011 RepID=UPI00404B44E3